MHASIAPYQSVQVMRAITPRIQSQLDPKCEACKVFILVRFYVGHIHSIAHNGSRGAILVRSISTRNLEGMIARRKPDNLAYVLLNLSLPEFLYSFISIAFTCQLVQQNAIKNS